MPTLFPTDEFELFWNAARDVIPKPSDERREFNAGSAQIAYRFRNCIEYKDELVKSWRSVGVAAPFEEQYLRERALFGMFVSGISSIESACYADYSLGAVAVGLPFDRKSRKYATPSGLQAQLNRAVPTAPLTLVLSGLLRSAEWKLWNDYRNTMAHRALVPRVIFASTGTLPPAKILEYGATWSTPALSRNEQELEDMMIWLAGVIRDLVNAGTTLAQSAIAAGKVP